jgi:aryl-alcohol dehydrogenase-like predicted oxidoreductase
MYTRELGKSGIEVSALGMGCWAIGGPWVYDNGVDPPFAAGWGQIDDKESIRAIHTAIDLGINFFDTAANYGSGHSERIIGKALKGRRGKVVIATKFGYVIDEERKVNTKDASVVIPNLRQDCEDSLKRLDTDYIDLYQFHVGDYDPGEASAVRDLLEELVKEGKIRWYGWSTDNAEGARVFADGEHCTAIQQALSWAANWDYLPTLMVCEEFDLASINRGPLGMGILTGKFKNADVELPDDDIRHQWDLEKGRIAALINMVESAREVLTSDGRTLAQGALGWLWARSEVTIPIPGFKTVAQVQENVRAMEFGPLSIEQMREIDRICGREPKEV